MIRFHKLCHPHTPCGHMFFPCLFFRLVEIVIPERHISPEKCEHVFFHGYYRIVRLSVLISSLYMIDELSCSSLTNSDFMPDDPLKRPANLVHVSGTRF